MENKNEVIKAFRKARIAGDHMLSSGKITWGEYAFSMAGYELILKEMGETL